MKHYAIFILVFLLINACSDSTTEKANTEVSDEKVADDAHTSQNSLEYWGTYVGKLLCADCEGIKILLIITENDEFKRKMTYIGKGNEVFEEKGKIKWREGGRVIELHDVDHPRLYKVGENSITQLDEDGEVITGELARMYVLQKQR